MLGRQETLSLDLIIEDSRENSNLKQVRSHADIIMYVLAPVFPEFRIPIHRSARLIHTNRFISRLTEIVPFFYEYLVSLRRVCVRARASKVHGFELLVVILTVVYKCALIRSNCA